MKEELLRGRPSGRSAPATVARLAQLHVVKAGYIEQDREGGGCTRIGLFGGGVRTRSMRQRSQPSPSPLGRTNRMAMMMNRVTPAIAA